MKRFLSFILVAVILVPCAFLFGGCSVAGKYSATKYVSGNDECTLRQYKNGYGKDDFMTVDEYNQKYASEQQSIKRLVERFSQSFILEKDGSLTMVCDYPKWFLDANSYYQDGVLYAEYQDGTFKNVGSWVISKDDDEIIIINGTEFQKEGSKLVLGSGANYTTYKKS